MSIATDVLARLLEVAEEHHVTRVSRVEVEIGAMRQVVPEAMDVAFRAVAEGTVAEGAALVLVETPIRAECNACGCAFKPSVQRGFACPECSLADASIVAGDDIILKSIEADVDEEQP